MGFGSLHEMVVDDIPSKIGLFVVDNFDNKKMQLKLKNFNILITPDLIHEMLGVPIGGQDINDLVKNKEVAGSLSRKWYDQFNNRYPTPAKVSEAITESKVDGDLFKMNMLVLFSNFFGLAGTGGQCRTSKIVPYINEETEIENIDWCKYVYDCLKESKDGWKKDDPNSYYAGALTVLIVSVYICILYTLFVSPLFTCEKVICIVKIKIFFSIVKIV